MPPRRRMPDISDVDVAELQLSVLAVLDAHGLGPEARRCLVGEFGAYLDAAGGPEQVLAEALARLRR